MENKVSNGFFAEFGEAEPAAVAKTEWRKDLSAKQPAMRVNAAGAFQFARRLGGNLPTTRQGAYAAAVPDKAGRDGPSQKDGNAAVGRSEPRAIDDPIQDEGPHSLRDLAGNGREWTRDLLIPGGSTREGPLDKPAAGDL